MVIVGTSTDEYTCLASCKRIDRLTSMFQRIPGNLYQQPLLRVHIGRFSRRNIEERSIKTINSIQEPTPSRSDCSRCISIWMVEHLDIPAFGGYLNDRITT